MTSAGLATMARRIARPRVLANTPQNTAATSDPGDKGISQESDGKWTKYTLFYGKHKTKLKNLGMYHSPCGLVNPRSDSTAKTDMNVPKATSMPTYTKNMTDMMETRATLSLSGRS